MGQRDRVHPLHINMICGACYMLKCHRTYLNWQSMRNYRLVDNNSKDFEFLGCFFVVLRWCCAALILRVSHFAMPVVLAVCPTSGHKGALDMAHMWTIAGDNNKTPQCGLNFNIIASVSYAQRMQQNIRTKMRLKLFATLTSQDCTIAMARMPNTHTHTTKLRSRTCFTAIK